MPTAGELRLEQAHQRDLVTIGAGVTSAVANLALGADPSDISTWFFTALDSITARVQTGYAQARRSGTGYIQSRATMAGADVDIRAGSLNLAQARTSLEVTGPVAFKRAIAAGADDETALLSMATQMSGSAQRLAIAGDRDVLEQTIAHGKGVLGYRRVLGGPGCGFCAMLASRGAVYLTRQTASTTKSGLRFHDHCRCHVEPLFEHEPDPPDVQRLQRQWQRITAGEQGRGKAVAWRDYWENQTTDRSKLRLAASKAGPPSPVPAAPRPTPGIAIRSALDAKKTLSGLETAWRAEAKAITGRVLDVEIPAGTSLQTAKEYAEGVLRGLERFPDAALERIRFTTGMATDHYAEAGGRAIEFSAAWARMANRPQLLAGMADDVQGWSAGRNGWGARGGGTTTATAVHEFGHIIDLDSLGGRVHSRALTIAQRHAALEGIDVDDLIARDISIYATSSAEELVAEAFMDVLMRGQAASQVARDIFDLVEAEYFRAGGRITPSFGKFPSKAGVRPALTPAEFDAALARAAAGEDALRASAVDLRTAAERKAYTDYVSEFRFVNTALRDNAGLIPAGRTFATERRVAAGLDSAMERAGLPEDIFVHRVAGTREFQGGIPTFGAEWTDLGYTSTSTSRKFGGRGEVEMRILVPRGQRAVSTAELDVNEVLLDRGTKFRVVRVAAPDERGVWKLDVEVMPSGLGAEPVAAVAKAAPSSLSKMSVADLRALAAERGVTLPAKALKADIVRALEEAGPPVPRVVVEPGAVRWLGKVDLTSMTAAEAERMGQLVQAASRREILDEIVELRSFGASNRALTSRIVGRSKLPNNFGVKPQVDDAFRDELLAAVDNGTIDDVVRRHLAALDVTSPGPIRIEGRDITADLPTAMADLPRGQLMNEILRRQGFDAPAIATDARGVDAAVDAGGIELFRGSSAERARALVSGDLSAAADSKGGGAFGTGIYTGGRGVAERYAGEGGLTRMALRSDARVITAEDLRAIRAERAPSWSIDEQVLFQDQGNFAAALGYDALAYGQGPLVMRNFVILNRTALVIEKSPVLRTAEIRALSPRALREYATSRGVLVSPEMRKADIVEALTRPRTPPTHIPTVAPVVEKPLAKRTVAELRALAKERQIILPPKATKAQIVEALQGPPLTPTQIRAAEQKALRDAARERNRQIEQATGTARLLAEVDELLAKKATAVTIRQRLDPALIRAEQVFANADPAVREALAAALASGDMAKVRAAITRLTTKAKLKVVGGKAGAKVKFDPDTMESLGAELADGAPVTVVTRGASVTLPDGTVVQVRKAQVTPAVPAPKPLTKQLTKRELRIIEAKRDIPVLEARLKALPIGDPARVVVQHRLDDVRAVIEQKPGPTHYNWSSPSWDDPGGSRILRPPTPAELSAHVDTGISTAVRGQTRADMVQELGRQAELTPRSMMQFRGVEDPARFDLTNHANAYAYYDHTWQRVSIQPDWNSRRVELERSYSSDITTNWHPPTSRTALEATTAHEYGHHVTYRLIEAPLIEQRRMIKLLDETFKLDGYLVRQFRLGPDIEKVITDFVSGPYGVGRVDRYVSRYAQKNYQEFFAEVWSEYTTMGDRARPQVKAIGDVMRRMAELSDVVSMP